MLNAAATSAVLGRLSGKLTEIGNHCARAASILTDVPHGSAAIQVIPD
jgi:hypothetical protein